MSNEEISKYIHEKILNKCWHTFDTAKSLGCLKDGCEDGFVIDGNPDYCSDKSERSLLNEVVAKVANEVVSRNYMAEHIALAMGIETQDQRYRWIDTVYANAEQIARACVKAHQEAL